MNKFVVLLVAAAAVAANACVSVPDSHKKLVQDSWDIAKRNGNLAPDTFIDLFKRNPTYQSMFSQFATVPLDQLKTNGDFLAQAYTVLSGLNVLVESLSSETLLSQQVAHLGIAHKPRGVKAWHFDETAKSLVSTLKKELGEALTPQAEDAWIDVLTAVNKAVIANLKDRYDVPHPETRLTPAEVKVVKGSWAKVQADAEAIGREVLLQLITDNAGYQQLFSKLASVDAAALASDAEFQKQAGQIIKRLDVIIDNLDNDLVLVGQLIYLGHTHFPRKVNREHFTKFGGLLVQSLVKRGASDAERAAWARVLSVLLDQVIDNLN